MPFLRNRSAEHDIKSWLAKNGYIKSSVKFAEVELHAIRRPGWHQIFRFGLDVETADRETVQLFGCMNADERYGPPKFLAYQTLMERDLQLQEWSEGMITLKQHRKQ